MVKTWEVHHMFEIRKISVDETPFADVLYLRWKELNKPDGYPLPDEPSDNDKKPDAIHVAAFHRYRVVGTVRVDGQPDGDKLIRQMAVAPDMRRRGIGAKVLALAEQIAVEEDGAETFRLNAKQDAVPFYQTQGYQLTDEEYLWQAPAHDNPEVHFVMVKSVE